MIVNIRSLVASLNYAVVLLYCHHVCYTAESFNQKVWKTLAENVSFGRRASYAEVAVLSGSPKACRAVGQAMRSNPIMLIIPCHRVVLSNGGLGNYSGGNKNSVKVWLLDHEQSLLHSK